MKNKIVQMEDLYSILGSQKLHSCSIEITNCCSFKCDHCYVDKAAKHFMSYEMFKKIIDELVAAKCNTILITGGECTLNPKFVKMYEYAKKLGMFVNINTNAYHFSDAVRNIFLKYKPDLVEITLYGYDNVSYEKFTHVKESYDKVIETIDFLSKNSIKFNLKATLTKDNYFYTDKLRKIAKKYNQMFRYDYIVFPKLNEIGKGRNILSITPQQAIDVIKQDKGDVEHFKRQVKATLKEKNKNHFIKNVFTCQIARGVIYIDSFGYIKPCTIVDKKYNINDISIIDAITEMKKYFDTIVFMKKSKCQNCYKRKLCRYCPGRFYLENGSYEIKSDFYCELADLLIKEFR